MFEIGKILKFEKITKYIAQDGETMRLVDMKNDDVFYVDENNLRTSRVVEGGDLLRVVAIKQDGTVHLKAADGLDVFCSQSQLRPTTVEEENKYLYAMIGSMRNMCSYIINYFALTEFNNGIVNEKAQSDMEKIVSDEYGVAKEMSKRIKRMF